MKAPAYYPIYLLLRCELAVRLFPSAHQQYIYLHIQFRDNGWLPSRSWKRCFTKVSRGQTAQLCLSHYIYSNFLALSVCFIVKTTDIHTFYFVSCVKLFYTLADAIPIVNDRPSQLSVFHRREYHSYIPLKTLLLLEILLKRCPLSIDKASLIWV